eukprot:TRINITY_DN4337_c0_g1_i1.p1 TRINITY_DN4337_c0_g1~~TRINITY_DN4337_c0_g1_i1.p1  ORF type:complete len:2657 (-),score=384.73 TRINITY_DN4337_c0_g1_i1:38-8008(-)
MESERNSPRHATVSEAGTSSLYEGFSEGIEGGYSNLLIRFTKIWESFVQVSWEKELFDGKEDKKYHFLMQGTTLKVEKYFLKHERTFRVHGLTPGANYKVAVRAMKDDDEWGSWCVAEVTTLCDVGLSVGEVGSTFIHGCFTWGTAEPDNSTSYHLKPAKFELKVKQKERVLDHPLCADALPPSSREFRITDLLKNGVFLVQVRAISENGDLGQWSAEVRFLTLNDVRVWVEQTGEDYAIAQWQREGAELSPGQIDDSLRELVIELYLEPDQRERDVEGAVKAKKIEEHTFDSSRSTTKFSNLKAGRAYRISYRYRNSLGDWSKWKEFCFLTLSPIAMVEFTAVSHDYIQFSWSREEARLRLDDSKSAQSNKDVVAWQVLATDCTTKEQTTIELPGEETVTKLVALVPSREYSISVRGKTQHGAWGLWGTERFVTTLPPLFVHLQSRGETWLQLTWERKERVYPDSVTRYHLQITGVNTPFRISKYFDPSETSFKCSGLRPGVQYYAAVQACVGVRWGAWSDPNEVATAGATLVRLSRRGEDFIQVKWLSEYVTSNALGEQDAKYQLRITKCRTFDPNDPTEPIDSSAQGIEVVNEILLGVTSYRLTKLLPGSRYSFAARTYDFHAQQWGIWSPGILFSTLSSAITFTEVSETFFEVTWQISPRIVSKVDDTTPYAEDALAPIEISKYVLRVNKILATGQSLEVGKFHFNAGRIKHTVSELIPNTEYTVQLCTCDTRGVWSSWSYPAPVTTIAPIALSVKDIGEDYANFFWKRESPITEENRVVLAIADSEFAISLTPLDTSGGESSDCITFTAVGLDNCAVRHLSPSTTYRVQIRACPLRTKMWGVWSSPIYIRTVNPIEISLDLVGEEFAHISWQRLAVPLPEAAGLVIMQPEGKVLARATPDVDADPSTLPLGGNPLLVGDPTVMEHHVQVHRLPPQWEERDEPLEDKDKQLQYEVFLGNAQSHLRIPSLLPETTFEVRVCGSNRWGEWGCWSVPFVFTTAMPTEVDIAEICQTHIKVTWGNSHTRLKPVLGVDAPSEFGQPEQQSKADPTVLKYQLRVVGQDDDFSSEVTLPPDYQEHSISGLNVNCCYSVQVRSLHRDDPDWGQWSRPLHVSIRSIPVNLLETSQDWMRVGWQNKQAKDLREKRLFITLINHDGTAATQTLPGDSIEYTFFNLDPASHYSVHLLCVEQVPRYVPLGGGAATTSPEGIPQFETQGAQPVTLPLVAADYASFFSDSATFMTMPPVVLEVLKLGENFICLKWRRGAGDLLRFPITVIADEEAEYEVETLELVDAPAVPQPQIQRVRGTQLTIGNLNSNTRHRFAVRQVSTIPSKWSDPVMVVTLSKIKLNIGGQRLTKGAADRKTVFTDPAPGVGEDFIMLNWEKEVHLLPPGTAFEVRIAPCDEDGQELTQRNGASRATVIKCADPRHHLQGLDSDTLYKVNVRTAIPQPEDPSVLMYGEWSDDVWVATLAPMQAAVQSVAEEHCIVRWYRRGLKGRGSTSLLNVNRYHVRVLRVTASAGSDVASARDSAPPSRPSSAGGAELAGRVVYDQQFTEDDPEFQACKVTITNGLRPRTLYVAQVRASTNNYWGGWSQSIRFMTLPSLVLRIPQIGEDSAFLEWFRSEVPTPSVRPQSAISNHSDDGETADLPLVDRNLIEEAIVERWEVRITTVGKEKQTTVELVAPNNRFHFIRGLAHNGHYTVCISAVYTSQIAGPFSNQIYFATLPAITVHVGRIGETSVHVRWDRQPQQRMTNRIRAIHRQQQAEFEQQQQQVQQRVKQLQQIIQSHPEGLLLLQRQQSQRTRMNRPAPIIDTQHKEFDPLSLSQLFTAEGSEADIASEEDPDALSDRTALLPPEFQQHIMELQTLQQLLAEQQRKQRELHRLQQLQLQELEKDTIYPTGQDAQYEVVISGVVDDHVLAGASSEAAIVGVRAGDPFTLRRKLERGLSSCKMDGLSPHSLYTVRVRAQFSNGFAVGRYFDYTPDAEERESPPTDAEKEEAAAQLLWGQWSDSLEFATLKQVTLSVSGLGSTHLGLVWDTGYTSSDNGAQNTSISRFQIRVIDRLKGEKSFKFERNLDSPSLRSFTVTGLKPNHQYTATIRVCYEDDKWGMWSNPVHVLLLQRMRAKLKTITESMAEFLVWREKQYSDDAELLVWRPPVTEHQLSINSIPSPSTFNIDLDTSTLLTLGDLITDTEFRVQVRERDHNREWREWSDLVTFETLPYAPSKPILEERRSTHVAVSWNLKKNCPTASYVFAVEMAYLKGKVKKGGQLEHDGFHQIGLLYEQTIRVELNKLDLPRCLFRVKVAKEHHALDGPRQVDESTLEPQAESAERPYMWSRYSPIAHFKTPSVPEHPTGIKIIQLRDTTAVLRWNKPSNYKVHPNILYKIYLNTNWNERFVCVAQTDQTTHTLENLAPNTHYRVAVTAESCMGVSAKNNTLMFSTHPPEQPLAYDKPMSTTLPPRATLKTPLDPIDLNTDPLRAALEAFNDDMTNITPPIAVPSGMLANSPLRSSPSASPTATGPSAGPSPVLPPKRALKTKQALEEAVRHARPNSATGNRKSNGPPLEFRSQTAGPYSKGQSLIGSSAGARLPALSPARTPSTHLPPIVSPVSGVPGAMQAQPHLAWPAAIPDATSPADLVRRDFTGASESAPRA